MADGSGYIGRSPSDSSVVIARQEYTPSGVTTDFTFTSGYTVGYVDVYLNGARLIEASDFNATDGSTVSLVTAAENGDVLEFVAYKAFNATNVTDATGNFTVGQQLTVSGVATVTDIYATGVVTATTFSGSGSGITGISTGVSINAAGGAAQRVVLANTTSGVANTMANTASLYWNDNTSTLYATNVNVSGTMTTEDTQNVDSTGIVTAGLGLRSTKGGLVVTAGISTFSAIVDANEEVQVGANIQLGRAGIVTALGLDISTGGVDIDGQTDLDELVVAGVATFSAALDIGTGGVDIDGQTDLDELQVAGVATFSAAIDAYSIDLDGQADLDEVVIAGVTTASNNVNVSGGTITVGTGITIAAVAGFGTFSKGVKLGKGGLLVEGISSVSAGFDNTSDLNLDDGMIHYTNDALAGNANTLNLTSGVGINTSMALNEMIVVTGITSVSSTSHYVNELTIDSVKARNICWIGGAAPTEGGSTGFDTYVFTIWKTGDAMYNVIANHVTTTA